GEDLLDEARRVLDGVERLHTFAAQSARGQRGRLRLGKFTAQELFHDLPGALRDFRQNHPNVDVRLIDSLRGSGGFAEDLLRGRLDIAFFSVPAPPELDVVELMRIPFVALVPATHPLASRRSVSLARLAAEDWVETPPGYGSRRQVERALAARGLTRRVVAEISAVPGIPAYVAAEIGISVIPEIIEPEGCAVLRVTDPIEPWTVSLATRRGGCARPLVGALVEVLRSHVRPAHDSHRSRLS
ncbi:MAG TPA: LysR substrate-binding domain-containing protein, partial [Solirubrobacteraceae bacterium]|nr:LysR substrate-binding domain-containing protein [Solirubrobacteraceae bacterium]